MKCGLLGRTLGHSYSPQIHGFLGSYSYELFEKEPEEVGNFLKHGDFSGINVTIPYKKTVIPYLDQLTPTAQTMGAVNTIVRRDDGTLLGHNTDYFGFSSMLRYSGVSVAGKKALVLGSGGASNTAVQVLQEANAQVIVISRTGENNYGNLHLHPDAAVIVNATPVGMYPNTGTSPVDLDLFPNLEGVLDLIYNPARTALLLEAETRGLATENGLWMLVAQAKEAAEYFTGTSIAEARISAIHRCLSRQMQNLILVGMPGCGKSTIGKQLAAVLGRPFADADEEIISMAGMSIPEIFAREGEVGFRLWETKALEKLGKQSGLVISTGGGCVTKQRNYPLLHQNGTILWLKRNLDQLPTDGRPLSDKKKMGQMFTLRKPLYESFSDAAFENNGTPEVVVTAILSYLEEY